MKNLGPCPKCGYVCAKTVPVPYSASDIRYKVECSSCGYQTAPAKTELEACVIWNDLTPTNSPENNNQKRQGTAMVFLIQGHAYLGVNKRDGQGNIIESTPARFESSREGPCIAVGMMDPDTMKQVGDVSVFGDYDAENYLEHVLELLAPTTRRHNLPDIKGIIKNMESHGYDVCDFCTADKCWNCAVRDWKD